MLLDSHNLDGIVAQLHHAWQHFGAEFIVGAHRFFVLRHADVALIDKQWVDRRHEIVDLKLIRLFRAPHLCGENFSHIVLHHPSGIGRDSFAPAAIPMHVQFIQIAVREGTQRQMNFPIAVFDGF